MAFGVVGFWGYMVFSVEGFLLHMVVGLFLVIGFWGIFWKHCNNRFGTSSFAFY